jgi:glycosyltransferase involved in cell wall biosynthesis
MNHTTLAGCTAAYVCEAAHATALAQSFLAVHPQAQFTILFIDGPNEAITVDRADLLYLEDLKIPQFDPARLPMLCNSKELRTVVTPALLATLLQRNIEAAVYFSEKTWILGAITDVLESIGRGAVLAATEKIHNNFGDSGRSFIAARRGSEEALRDWNRQLMESLARRSAEDEDDWSRRLADELDSIAHQSIAVPGFSLSYSNLEPGLLTGTGRDYRVGEHRVSSFDFRGYDPDKPYILSRYQGTEPRILLSQYSTLASLCDEYRGRVLNAGHRKYAAVPCGFESLPDGPRIDARMRRLYRAAIQESDATGKVAPSPFGPGGRDKFVAWLNEPLTKTARPVTRYMLAVRADREDIRKAFPEPLGENAQEFSEWYVRFGQSEMDLPDELVPKKPAVSARASEAAAKRPVNVAGFFRAELGIGVAARSILSALEAAGIPFNTISFDATESRQLHPFAERTDQQAGDINVVCVNPDTLPIFAERTGPEWRHGRYMIGVWFWEVEDFPRSLHHAFNYVDEIWVASEFMRQTFLKVSPKPVFKFLLPVQEPKIDRSLTRSDLHLPHAFIFLFSFDFFSVLERKNPVGLIEAFSRAFRPGEGPVLVIKSINGDKRSLEMEKLKYAARSRPDIILRDGYLSEIEKDTLSALSDCYVSLHRSEGFGLTIAEAIALGKPAIATAYSGNLEFMTQENSYLCPSRRVGIGPEMDPYPATSFWSEPDLDAAAKLLRHVYEHQAEAKQKGVRAAEDIRALHSPAMAALLMRDRLARIRRRRDRPGLPRSVAFLEDRLEELESETTRQRPD